MENENKNKGGGKTRKHKPYFIAPNTEQKDNAPKAASVPTAPTTANADSQQKSHRHKNKPKNHNTPKQETAPIVQKPIESAPIEQKEKPLNNDNRARHNKNKHRKHSDAPIKEINVAQNNAEVQENIESPVNDFAISKFDKLEKPAPKKLESFSASPEYQKYHDYEEFTYEELYGSINETSELSTPEITATEVKEEAVIEEEPQIEVVGIRFKASGKTYYFAPNGITLRIGLHAIVETARGLEYGEVVMSNTLIPESETVPPLRPVVRAATQADILHNEEIKKLEENAFKVCNEKIIAHGLDMKLIDAQYTFDNTKLLFYFTSSGRVDFRELVKDLASVFRTRIELRQIGIRDEAKMVGGLGICGRPLCCSKFLTDFGQVSIKMAKEQNLSLNSAKISGICGRLMCCLRYEHDTYEYEIKRTPPVDTLVRTVDGVGTVTEISPLQGTIKVRLAATPEVMPKSYKREDVNILKKKN